MTPAHDSLLALLSQRKSCRDFAPDPLDQSALDALSRAFALAPSAGNRHDARCFFITDRAAIRNLAEQSSTAFDALCRGMESPFLREEMERYGHNFFWFASAPALACVVCRRPPAFLEESAGDKAPLLWGGELSAAMAAFALLLAAESLDIGACCLTGPLAVWRDMERLLNIPKRETLVLLVALGRKKEERNTHG